MRSILRLTQVFFVVLLAVPAAHADTTYNYTGNTFTSCSGSLAPSSGTTCGGNVTISFETILTGSALDNLSNQDISATVENGNIPVGVAGHIYCVELNECDYVANGSGSFSVVISTNAVGQITSWDINANNANNGGGVTGTIVSSSSGGDSLLISTFNYDCDPSFGPCNGAASVPIPGIWSGPIPTPEPASCTLMLLGIGFVFAIRKRLDQGFAVGG